MQKELFLSEGNSTNRSGRNIETFSLLFRSMFPRILYNPTVVFTTAVPFQYARLNEFGPKSDNLVMILLAYKGLMLAGESENTTDKLMVLR